MRLRINENTFTLTKNILIGYKIGYCDQVR